MKSPPKLSKQENRIYDVLREGNISSVLDLFRIAKDTTTKQALRISPRRRQQHVGVLIARLRVKRRSAVIKPVKGKPGTYRLTRRRH